MKLLSLLHNICLDREAQKSFFTSILDIFQFIFTRNILMLVPGQTDIRESIYKLNTPIFSQKKFIFLYYSLRKATYQKIN